MPARGRLLGLILAAGASLTPAGRGEARADEDDLRLAVVAESTVYVVSRDPFGALSLDRADLTDGKARPSSPLGGDGGFRRSSQHAPRWRIDQGYYWGVVLNGGRGGGGFGGFRRFQPQTAKLVRVPLTEFRPLAADAPAAVEHAADAGDGPPHEVGSADPLASAMTFAWMARSGPVYFDLVPIGTHACRLYLVFDGQMEVWDYRFHWDRRSGLSGRWREVRRLPLTWDEPFLALPEASGRLFLATGTGSLWDVGAGPGSVPRLAWSDPARPIRWVVLDAPRHRAFALGRGFTFRVESTPDPLALTPRPPDANDDSLSSALQAVRCVLPEP